MKFGIFLSVFLAWVYIALVVVALYAVATTAYSAYKYEKNLCDVDLKMDAFLNGDLFCPVAKGRP